MGRLTKSLLLACGACVWVPSALFAQTVGNQSGAPTPGDGVAATTSAANAGGQIDPAQEAAARNVGQLEDIVVTAQRRTQTLQDVPVSVAVINTDAIVAQHVSSIDGLGTLVPGLAITRSPFQPFIAIRGLGSGGGTRAFEQSVATYVDGVYAGRANQFLNPFFDIDRVEVVRGPQSVLFGVNAIAGAINIVNRKPGKDVEGYATAGYEAAYDGYNFEGGVSVPLTETLAVRVAGKVNREGGYLHNTVSGKDEPDTHSQIGRITMSWKPVSDFRADLSYEHAHKSVKGSGFETTYLPLAGVFPANVEDGKVDFKKSSPGTSDFTKLTTDNITLNMSLDLDWATLTSVSGYSHYNFDQALPAGAVPIAFGTALDGETFEQFYQEVRLASSGTHLFDYLVGAAYIHQRSVMNQGVDFDLTAFGAPGTTFGVRNALNQRTNTVSLFGQGTINLSDNFNIVAGGRYTHVNKRGNYLLSASAAGAPLSGYAFNPAGLFIGNALGFFSYLNPANPGTIRPTIYNRSLSFDPFNYSLSANYKIGRRLSVYASYTTGTKAGGFNDQEKTGIAPENGFATDAFTYAEEKARNLEVGLKGNTGTFRYNLAAFYTRYSDLQASQAVANGSIFTTNAARATAKGIEADLTWLATRGLTLSVDGAYIHARYKDYPGSGCIITLAPSTCNPANTNARGGRMDGVPEFTGSVNIAYVVPLNDKLELRTRGRVYYNDGAQYQSNQDPLDRVPSYTFLDASIEIGQTPKGWSLSLSGKNLANKVARGFSSPSANPLFGHQSLILPGRQVYIDLRLDF